MVSWKIQAVLKGSNTAVGASTLGVQTGSSLKLRNFSKPMRFCWAAGPIKGLPLHGQRCLAQERMGPLTGGLGGLGLPGM